MWRLRGQRLDNTAPIDEVGITLKAGLADWQDDETDGEEELQQSPPPSSENGTTSDAEKTPNSSEIVVQDCPDHTTLGGSLHTCHCSIVEGVNLETVVR